MSTLLHLFQFVEFLTHRLRVTAAILRTQRLLRLVLVGLPSFHSLLQSWTLRLQSCDCLLLGSHGILQVSDQAFFQLVKLVQFLLVHRTLNNMLFPHLLVRPLNGSEIGLPVILLLVVAVSAVLVPIRRVGLLVRQI